MDLVFLLAAPRLHLRKRHTGKEWYLTFPDHLFLVTRMSRFCSLRKRGKMACLIDRYIDNVIRFVVKLKWKHMICPHIVNRKDIITVTKSITH